MSFLNLLINSWESFPIEWFAEQDSMFNTFPKVQIFLHCYIIMFICLCTCNSPMHVQVFLYAKKIELKI